MTEGKAAEIVVRVKGWESKRRLERAGEAFDKVTRIFVVTLATSGILKELMEVTERVW